MAQRCHNHTTERSVGPIKDKSAGIDPTPAAFIWSPGDRGGADNNTLKSKYKRVGLYIGDLEIQLLLFPVLKGK